MEDIQHPDSIWTWKTNQRRSRAALWVPYLHAIENEKGKKWKIIYKGGEISISPDQIDTIMFYGASGMLPLSFIDDMIQAKIVILIHRRNLSNPACFYAGQTIDRTDILTAQIISRQNNIKACYIARRLVEARFDMTKTTSPISETHRAALKKMRKIEDIRSWEAYHARLYWDRYFTKLGFPDCRRRSKNALSSALDAGSMFMTGILLRWILVHKLSPAHGFLHVRTEYTSLVYDLMEPYRYMIEEALRRGIQKWDGEKAHTLTANTLTALKQILDETIYVPTTRQTVRRKNLLHGSVLALRAYLIGEMSRFTFLTFK